MGFADFEGQLMKQNRYLMYLSAGSLLVFGIVLALVLGQKSYFIYQGEDFFKERLLAEQVCKESFVSITEGEPNPHLVSEGIREILGEKSFDVKISKLLRIHSLERGACKIILDSEGELLSFKISMVSSESYPFFYKLNQIDELPVKEKSI